MSNRCAGHTVGFIACLAGMLLTPMTVSSAPQQTGAATSTFTAQADLVLVPVLVRKGGQHMPGLAKEDFTLLQDGKPQAIAVFEEVHAVRPNRLANTAEFSNVRGEGQAQQLTIIAIDTVNTEPLDQAYLRQEVVKFLDSASTTGEPFALVAIDRRGLHILHDFTTDPKQLADVVRNQSLQQPTRERAGGTPLDVTPCAGAGAVNCGSGQNTTAPTREWQEWVRLKTNEEPFEIYRDRTSRMDSLGALIQLAQSLRGLPGRKTLVWASSGAMVLGGMSRLFSGNLGGVGEALDQAAYTYNLLSSANVAVYPLDARHGSNTSFANYDVVHSDAPMDIEKEATRNRNNELTTGFEQIAAATGGRPCYNRTDLANCLKEAASDSHDYYMLGFYADKKTKTGWHAIGVKLGQKADLRYRNGFLMFPPKDPDKIKLTDLQLAMLSPLSYGGVTITGKFTGMEDVKDGKKAVSFDLDLPPDALSIAEEDSRLAFDVVAVARNAEGREVGKLAQRFDRKLQAQQAAQIRAEGVHYSNMLQLDPGTYGVWVVVRDNVSGRTGSALTTLTVR